MNWREQCSDRCCACPGDLRVQISPRREQSASPSWAWGMWCCLASSSLCSSGSMIRCAPRAPHGPPQQPPHTLYRAPSSQKGLQSAGRAYDMADILVALQCVCR